MKLSDIAIRLTLDEWSEIRYSGPWMKWWYGQSMYVVLKSDGLSLAVRNLGLGVAPFRPDPQRLTADRLRQLDRDVAAGGEARALSVFYAFITECRVNEAGHHSNTASRTGL
jgi:hypothetical protein